MPDAEYPENKKPARSREKPASGTKNAAAGKAKGSTTKKASPGKRSPKRKPKEIPTPLPAAESPVPFQKQEGATAKIPRTERSREVGGLLDAARRAGRTVGKIARMADRAVDTVRGVAKKIGGKG